MEEVLLTEAGSKALAFADETIEKVAADLLTKHESHPHYRAALFAAMGDGARERYFRDEAHEPWILRSPFCTDEQRTELIELARSEMEASMTHRLESVEGSLVSALRRTGRPAEDVGEALAALVREEDMDELFEKCRGHSFPTALRRLLWKRRLFVDGGSLTKKTNPNDRNISGTVTRLVEETFSASWRNVVAEKNHVLRVTLKAEQVLNDLYAVSAAAGSHFLTVDRRSAYVAIAISHLFCDDDERDEENVVLCLLFNMLTSLPPRAASSSPSIASSQDRRDEADDISRSAMITLRVDDNDLYQHLETLSANDLLRPFVDAYLAPLLPLETLLFVWDHCLLDIGKFDQHLSHGLATVLKLLRFQLLTAQTFDEAHLVLQRSQGFVAGGSSKHLRRVFSAGIAK